MTTGSRRLLCLLLAGACAEKVTGLEPVGGELGSPAERERFVRRLHLDLTAAAPDDAALAAGVARLDDEGNSAATRAAMADELLARPEFAESWVSELENRVFAGEDPAARFGLLCVVYRNFDPMCQACPPDPDPCANCDCYYVADLAAERELFTHSAGDLAGGVTTGEIERRYGGASVFQYSFGDPAVTTSALFDTFLGRPAENEEMRQGRAMVIGAIGNPDSPAGLIFHRHGSNYDDLVDIVFDSEAYREAVVSGVFRRYLGRDATPVEQGHFADAMDAAAPDARPVIRAAVSSREYFAQ